MVFRSTPLQSLPQPESGTIRSKSWMDGSSALSAWIRRDVDSPGYLRLVHRYLADLLLRDAIDLPHPVDLAELSSRACQALGPLVSPLAISQQTHAYKVVRDLSHRTMVARINSPAGIDRWYADLEAVFGWNSRYWEQRALAISADDVRQRDHPSYEKAFSWASRGVTCHRDPYSLNTLGTVLLRRALDEFDKSVTSARKFWIDGVEALWEAAEQGEVRVEHPFVTLFTYSRRLLHLSLPDDWRALVAHDFQRFDLRLEDTPAARGRDLQELRQEVRKLVE